jgi:hypothetical protein
MNIHPWIIIVLDALALARKLGHEPPGVEQAEAAWADLNAAAGKLLPAEIAALTFFAQRNAAATVAAIDSMPKDPRCPRCDNVLTRRVLTSPHDGTSEAVSSHCDRCGWPTITPPGRQW